MPCSNGIKHGVDMNTPLVTRDGFPRADIDVAQSEQSPFQERCAALTDASPDNQVENYLPPQRLQRPHEYDREANTRAFCKLARAN